MAVDEVVEIFQATIIIAVMGVVALSLINANIGDIALDILPGFIEVVVYVFVIMAIVAAVFESIKEV